MTRPRLIHVATVDASLDLLLGPQLEAFAAVGYEVIGASAPGPHVPRLEAAGIRHVALRHATRAMRPGRDAAALLELVRLFRALRPQIVHTHNPKPGLYGRLAARAARVPVVVNTVHGLYALPEDPVGKRAVVYSLERLAATCSQAELVQNREDLETMRRLGFPAERLSFLGNGVDLDRFQPIATTPDRAQRLRREWGAAPGDVVCTTVGRLVWEKGYRELFEAADLLRGRAPSVHVVAVGPADPDKADAVPSAAMERAAEAGVVLTGMRDDMDDIYAATDVFVLASHREGVPRAAMEAAACGLPIVATDIRGCRQVVEHGVTGFLVPPCDPGALAGGMARLAHDVAERQRMGAAARRKATAEFDHRRVIDTTLEVYDRLLRQAGLEPPSPRPAAAVFAAATTEEEPS